MPDPAEPTTTAPLRLLMAVSRHRLHQAWPKPRGIVSPVELGAQRHLARRADPGLTSPDRRPRWAGNKIAEAHRRAQLAHFQIGHAHQLADCVSRSPGSVPRHGQRKTVAWGDEATSGARCRNCGGWRGLLQGEPPAASEISLRASLASRSVLLRKEMPAAANAAATERTRIWRLIRREIGAD
jgi:hypothetical protein